MYLCPMNLEMKQVGDADLNINGFISLLICKSKEEVVRFDYENGDVSQFSDNLFSYGNMVHFALYLMAESFMHHLYQPYNTY